MSAERAPGPWVSHPAGEMKLMLERGMKEEEEELSSCNQEGRSHSEEPFCRICHEGGASGELLSPCECCGSLAIMHQVCLERWLTTSNSSHCELCHHTFALEHLPKPFSE
ncbi:hypothetical protein LDENG_00244070, partial [Lucifuga dentata]